VIHLDASGKLHSIILDGSLFEFVESALDFSTVIGLFLVFSDRKAARLYEHAIFDSGQIGLELFCL
jgi:hypothetical protein